MTDKSPIKPTPDLVNQWQKRGPADATINNSYAMHIAIQAAQWGADQELEACCEWLSLHHYSGLAQRQFRTARRPKPPSLKEQALEQLECIQIDLNKFGMGISTDTIRRALEQLND
jgi:hypothetical protein